VTAATTGALDGVLVADFSRVLSGPYCTMMLGDLGADVIKVERPGSGDETRGWGPPFAAGESAYYLSINRNKRSITLDLARSDHREAARRLVAKAHVLVENFRPGTMERLGFGYETVAELNPRLVYASITGFGDTGPARDEPGYDYVAQARGGIMSVTGEPGREPQKVGVAIADITTGLYCTIAVLAALRTAEETGRGQRVHTSLLESQVGWLANQASNYLVGGMEPTRMGNAHPNIVPYQVFHASDRPFVVAVANEIHWQRFCSVMGLGDLERDPRFADNAARVANRDTLIEVLAERFKTRTRDEWIAALGDAEVPCGPINSIAEVFDDPQVRALGLVETVRHPTIGDLPLVRSPLGLGATPAATRRPPPLLGEHTLEILSELGYSDAEVRSIAAGDGI
jgi:crotonobetainyl-CoA:carnitine CoA-transferase CaiB-like acyl-CoA transferase